MSGRNNLVLFFKKSARCRLAPTLIVGTEGAGALVFRFPKPLWGSFGSHPPSLTWPRGDDAGSFPQTFPRDTTWLPRELASILVLGRLALARGVVSRVSGQKWLQLTPTPLFPGLVYPGFSV